MRFADLYAQILWEPPCADFVAGAALCEPPCARFFVAGAALCELHVQISWPQHFVNLHVQISWQAQHFVNLHVPDFSWLAQLFVNCVCRFRGRSTL